MLAKINATLWKSFHLTFFLMLGFVISCKSSQINSEIPLPAQDLERAVPKSDERRVVFYNDTRHDTCASFSCTTGASMAPSIQILLTVNEKKVAFVDENEFLILFLKPGGHKIILSYRNLFASSSEHELVVGESDIFIRIAAGRIRDYFEVATAAPVDFNKYKSIKTH